MQSCQQQLIQQIMLIDVEDELENLQEKGEGLKKNGQDRESDNLGSVLHKIDPVSYNPNIKQDALEYDIKLGWLPRSQITGPIPLSFSHFINDDVIQSKTSSLLYLGYRPSNTFELHEQFYEKGKKYPFYQFHLCKSLFLQRFFKKHYSDYDFSGRQSSMILQESPLTFNSFFETGNLDAVYYQEQEYRLLLRVDSNTLGHCNYYNFKVKANKKGKYVFRILNINKLKSLYQRGMKPYVRYFREGKWTQFQQSGHAVRFADSPLIQQFKLNSRLKSMKFTFEFQYANTDYQFCYTIPFGYSDLLTFVRQQKNVQNMHMSKLCHTLSGVQIPLLTITDKDRQKEEQQDNKNDPFVIVITGRVHPSQANGSHIVNGVIKSLLGDCQESRYLKKRVIFKIIPMLNPDGVIIGNTRTSFSGKDLNRKYFNKTDFVFPQIIGTMDYVAKLKLRYKQKLLFLIDVHGHSSRKNSFFFGPQFSIIDQQYSRCRLLPKFYSQRTDLFRYYSCKFKVASYKQTTARGYFNSNGLRTYTHETSMHCYFDFQTRGDKPFTKSTFQKLGEKMVKSIYDYVKYLTSNIRQTIEIIPQQKLIKKRVKGIDFDPQDDDSQDISSDKADSQDEIEDFQQKKLKQFFNRINQNKQYFYEELLAFQKIGPDSKEKMPKQEKIRNKSEAEVINIRNEQPLRIESKKLKIEQELIMKKPQTEKIDWASKASYPQKKKQFQEYTKMSSVIFGSSIPLTYFNSKANQKQYSQTPQFNQTKYSIKYLQAQFQQNSTKYPSPEPKIYRSHKPIKRQGSFKVQTQQSKGKQIKQKDKEKEKVKAIDLQRLKFTRYLQLKEEVTQFSKFQKSISTKGVEKISTRPSECYSIKPVPICSVDLVVEKKQEQQQIMRLTTSLKVLTRKKSIKNIRQSQSLMTRKVSKNSIGGGSLTRKLPSLHSILHKY